MCLLAAPWVQLSVSVGSGWPHNALRHQCLMPISCHFRDCKALLVTTLTHVSGVIYSKCPDLYLFYLYEVDVLYACLMLFIFHVNLIFSTVHTALINTWYNDYVMRPRSYSRGLRNRKTYANANAKYSVSQKTGTLLHVSFQITSTNLMQYQQFMAELTFNL